MDNVTFLRNTTRLDIPADRVLKAALDNKPSSCVVIGYDADEKEYYASSLASGPDVLWLLESLKLQLLNIADEEL